MRKTLTLQVNCFPKKTITDVMPHPTKELDHCCSLSMMLMSSGTGDISTTDNCREDIERFCTETKPGENRLLACLTNQLNDEEAGKAADEGGKLSDSCKEEMRAVKAER